MDRENKIGAQWSPELTTALARCRVFVPLYSRRYFESDNCGREWFAFARREITRRARGGQVVDAIVPALWTRLDRDRLPYVAQSVQFDHKFLGERYCTEGFYGIMKLQNYRADYQRAVHRLAERIIAIGDESGAVADEARGPQMLPAGLRFAAECLRPGQRQAHRGRPACRSRCWPTTPLRFPRAGHPITTAPRRTPGARTGRITPSRWPTMRRNWPRSAWTASRWSGSSTTTSPRRAGNGQPVPPSLCLVDPWVSLSAKHQEQLNRLDQVDEPWVSVLVPWNSQDLGTARGQGRSSRESAAASGPQARRRPAPLSDGRERNPHPPGFWPAPARDDDDHAEEIPQGSDRPSARRSCHRAPAAEESRPQGSRRCPMSETSQGQIITFYSYKGGTGRTMALANVAWILASNGKRVLSVDWDLESPGLHKFFHPFLDESTVSATPGVIEIINDYASAAVDPGPRSDDWHLEFAQVERHAVSLDWAFPDGGKLDFLSAGRQNRDYSAAVCSLDWDNFYDRLGGGRFFRAHARRHEAEVRLRADRQPHRAERRGRHLHDRAPRRPDDLLHAQRSEHRGCGATWPARSAGGTGTATSGCCPCRCASRTARRRSSTSAGRWPG